MLGVDPLHDTRATQRFQTSDMRTYEGVGAAADPIDFSTGGLQMRAALKWGPTLIFLNFVQALPDSKLANAKIQTGYYETGQYHPAHSGGRV